MKRSLILYTCAALVLAALILAVLATCYHRVIVVDGIDSTPIPGAYISLERSSAASEEVGRTDANGKLTFWSTPLPLPRTICAQSTFYPLSCVRAIGLAPRIIELAVIASIY